jgi:hypothetical protein
MSKPIKRRTKAATLFDLELLWPYDNPANIARRLGYARLDYLLRTLERWPEGKMWAARLQEADTLQRGNDARYQPLDEAS